MPKFSRLFLFSFFLCCFFNNVHAQVNAVTFGKNRVQFKKLKWNYYQTDNFNVYFYSNGQELAKYVLQVAEKELNDIEQAAEYSLQRRANILVYNNYNDFQQSNVGLNTDILNSGSSTQLVNNKMLVYFDGNHEKLKIKVREGIADVITKNMLFGDNLGEVASNQTFLDLPKWLTDGYVAYLAEHWNTALDDELKGEILSGDYTKFSKFSAANPALAGHAFWYFIEEKYKKENVTFFLYVARTNKSINKASLQITKKSFKALLAEFMIYEEEKYENDLRKRKAYPKGSYVDGFDITPQMDYYRFNVNPIKKNNSYLVTQFKKGIVRVLLNDEYENTTLLKFGIRTTQKNINPNYPMMAWDPKGTKFTIAYSERGKLLLLLFDATTKEKKWEIDLTDKLDQIQDMKYMLNSRTLLLSAVKNGHTDIFTFDLEKEKLTQITNDVYDDLDATFVSFPNKTGIVFASNRPTATAENGDTILPSDNRYNIFMVTNFGDKAELNQITKLTDLKYGNARYPAQYNVNHFTFVSDENGIANRYAGFFTTKNMGSDTLILIGDDILRNPTKIEIDSALQAQQKIEIDSVAVVRMTSDSTYSFPLTNYESSLAETKSAGDDRILSEVTRSGNEKNLYKLKLDVNALSNRNVTAQPTEFGKKLMRESRKTKVAGAKNVSGNDVKLKPESEFQSEFEKEKTDSTAVGSTISSVLITNENNVLDRAKLYAYKPIKFSADFGSASFSTTVLFNKYQPYGGGSGPIMLSSNTPLNGLITLGTSDLMEDKKVLGGFKIGTNLKDNEWFVSYQNLRRRIDWGVSYYRNVLGTDANIVDGQGNILATYPGKMVTNFYMGNVSYPFDETKSIRLSSGIRSDLMAVSNLDQLSASFDNQSKIYSNTHLEYVHDNSLNKMNNIWNGLRYKTFIDWNRQVRGLVEGVGATMFNFGFDARYYYPIYKNFIWAGRAAGDFSWGNQKIIYYLGGVDGWLMFGNNVKPGTTRERYFNSSNAPAQDATYAFQSLALNMRGYIQNISNGNNAIVLNSEFRLPVMSTIFDKISNNAFLRDFQITQFIDLGSAWNGSVKKIKRPETTYNTPITLPNGDQIPGPVTVKVKTGGVGPFVGGYGFGARSTLFGYFMKYDISWPMNTFFGGKPIMYVSLGLDF